MDEEERLTFEIDSESAKRFKKKCIDDNVTMSNVLRAMIWEYIEYYPHKKEDMKK